jgi:adenylylsulfate kinase-like enzyme
MALVDPNLVLVVIVGPQASGKSTVASALCTELRNQREQVALVELDLIAGISAPKSSADWDTAHRIFEVVVGEWARAGMTCVIAEGSGSEVEVVRLLDQTPPGARVLTVAATVPFGIALERAQGDPTRGISKEYNFLNGVYEAWSRELEAIAPDLTLDTSQHTLEECVGQVRSAIQAVRRTAGDSQDCRRRLPPWTATSVGMTSTHTEPTETPRWPASSTS